MKSVTVKYMFWCAGLTVKTLLVLGGESILISQKTFLLCSRFSHADFSWWHLLLPVSTEGKGEVNVLGTVLHVLSTVGG